MIIFFENGVSLQKSDKIFVYGDATNIAMNVYGIFESHYIQYALPYIIEDSGDAGINWADAKEKCQEKYGTTLASIHSNQENFLMKSFLGNNNAWVGLFDLALEKQNNWKWDDLSTVQYTNWAPGEPNNANGEDCVHIYPDGTWNDIDCLNSAVNKKYVCSLPYWPPNTKRLFQINVPKDLANITLISMGNNHETDDLCIDSIKINDKSASYISNNIIGTKSGSLSLNAIFQYPVCSTEVVGVSIDYASSIAHVLPEDSKITGLECANYNRLLSSTCSIAQTYELSKTTSFSISSEDSRTNEYSWGSSSSVSLGTTSSSSYTASHATSNEFSWGMEQSFSIGVSATKEASLSVGIASASASVTVSADLSFGMWLCVILLYLLPITYIIISLSTNRF